MYVDRTTGERSIDKLKKCVLSLRRLGHRASGDGFEWREEAKEKGEQLPSVYEDKGSKGKKLAGAEEKEKTTRRKRNRKRKGRQDGARFFLNGMRTDDGKRQQLFLFFGGLIFISVLSSHGVTKGDDRGRSPTLTIHPPV